MAIQNKFSPRVQANAKALEPYRKPFEFGECPTVAEAKQAIPAHCFVRSLPRSMMHAIISAVLAGGMLYVAWRFFPAPSLSPLVIALYVLYAFVEGTLLTGCWVIAHECGHGAFCDNPVIQDAVGYVFHSMLLVPYFSWQRSHAVHHQFTNSMTEGETHVPNKVEPGSWGDSMLALHDTLGDSLFGAMNLFNHLAIGWPLYLLFGFTGSPERGISNHFVPFNDKLFPGMWRYKVLLSDIGVLVTLGLLMMWAREEGWAAVLALYGGPYLVANGWLVLYTWLQHTDVDIPHYEGKNWTWVRGVFATVDRPYGPVINFLHHGIGSTHVAHHLCHTMPHYHAWEATRALQAAFPKAYLYDPTPIIPAMWRVARRCVAAVPEGDGWVYVASRKDLKSE
eukprot:RCo045901